MLIELAKPGTFGQDGAVVTKEMLQEVTETFSDDAPITLGHQNADWMPRFGDVKKLVWDSAKEMLFADIELTPALQEARDAGYFKKWSAGIRKLADTGKRYLHHVAFLGAVPPKIKGLKTLDAAIVNMSDVSETWTFGDDDKQTQTNKEEENMAGENKEKKGTTEKTAVEDGNKKTAEVNLADNEQFKDMQKQVADANAREMKTKKTVLQAALEKGSIPKDKHPLVLNLADALDLSESIELSDGENKTRKVSGMDLLIEVISAIPAPVRAGLLDLGDLPAGENEVKLDMNKMLNCC